MTTARELAVYGLDTARMPSYDYEDMRNHMANQILRNIERDVFALYSTYSKDGVHGHQPPRDG